MESVGLRVTQVRDVDGVLWYVRNGEILRVGNHSQGWSRAVVDIALDYNTDVDAAKRVIEDAAGKVASEPGNTEKVIGEPTVVGIQVLSGDQVVVRVVQQVKFGKADDLAIGLRTELKRSLDAAGKVASEPGNTEKVIGEPTVVGIQVLSGDQVVVRVVQQVKFGKADDLAIGLRTELKRSLDASGIKLATTKQSIFLSTK